MPIDLAVSTRNSYKLSMQKRLLEDDPYFAMIHAQWGDGLRRVFAQLPNPDWNDDGVPDSEPPPTPQAAQR